jgi:CheY-like chemotaxis protein
VGAYSAGLDQGSEFVVRLPLVKPGARSVGAAAPTGHEATPVEPCRVLVVDDNRDTLESTAMSLRLFEHEVATAETGRRALELAGMFEPDVIVIDIGMPDMDGFELATQIRDRRDGAGLVALSGYGDANARDRGRAAGFDEYLVKPVSPEELNEVIGRVCTASRATSRPGT